MQALDILKDLQRKYAERLRYSWPNEDVEKSCNASIKKINNIFSNDIENIDFNNTSQREFLSNLLYKYLVKDDNKFSVKLIEQFSAWFFHCYIQNNKDTGNNIKLYQLSDKLILGKIFKLFDTVGVNKQLIGDNLMTSYLNLYKNCSQQFKKLLKSFINHINIINNLDLYFDQELFIRQIQNTDIEKENYSEYLLTKLIRNRFINTKYFSDMWFWWVIICADVLSEKFIKNNIVAGFYPTVDLDQQKVILAYMANRVEQIQGNETRNSYFMNYLIPVIGNHNPTHIEYWNITNKKLENLYGKLLKVAPQIFRRYYISEFIIIFFDALESTGGDEDRAI